MILGESSLRAFGAKVEKIRKNKGLTQEELADRVGVSQAMINFIEKGKKKPSLDTAIAIADEFNTKIRIPLDSIIDCGKEFISADEFNRKQSADVDNFFTVTSGDYIIFGDMPQEIDEEMLTTNQNVHKITDCADNTSALATACKHIRIFCNEH